METDKMRDVLKSLVSQPCQNVVKLSDYTSAGCISNNNHSNMETAKSSNYTVPSKTVKVQDKDGRIIEMSEEDYNALKRQQKLQDTIDVMNNTNNFLNQLNNLIRVIKNK